MASKQVDHREKRGQKEGKGGSRAEQKGNDQREEAWLKRGVKEGNDSQKRSGIEMRRKDEK
jgi:hypothetical protein